MSWRAGLAAPGNPYLHQNARILRSVALDRRETLQEIDVPDYWESEMLPAPMRNGSGHDGSHAFIAQSSSMRSRTTASPPSTPTNPLR